MQIERDAFIADWVLQIKREILGAAACGLAFYEGGKVMPCLILSFDEKIAGSFARVLILNRRDLPN